MKIRKSLAALPLSAMVALAPNVQGQSLGGIETEQNQQQRRDAQQREAAVAAPAVRSTVTKIEAYPRAVSRNVVFPHRPVRARRARHAAGRRARERRIRAAARAGLAL
ncbi:hypothetical protein [Paraburkholderia tropica]|uniref:hypothetical protein n=1 Tax=Paraburkholderia tropica TaxID=92647 RepID=UPI0031DFA377